MRLSKLILAAAWTTVALTTLEARAEQGASARRNRAPAAVTAPAPTPAPYIPPAAPSVATNETGPRTSSFKWDLYLDVEARLPSKSGDNLPDRGFTLNDAALYMTKDFGRGIRGLIELPFASDPSSKTGAVGFLSNRTQAYIESERWAPLYFRAGQYNTFMGVEANDSRDRFFADLGLIKGYLLRPTFTGVQVGYRANQIAFAGQITNPNGASTMAGQNPEIGLNARFESGQAYGAGGLTVNDDKAVSTGNKTNMTLDLTGGWGANRLKVDGEITWLKQAGSDKDGTAFGVFASYGIDDALSVGGRLEYGRDVGVTGSAAPTGIFDSIVWLSAGPAYRLQSDLSLRGDFSLINLKSATYDDTTYTVTASLVASF